MPENGVYLVNAAEIGRALRPPISRERVRQLADRPGFPRPSVAKGSVRLWDFAVVRRWARENGREIA